MPPSVNSAYTGKERRVKSYSYSLYESTLEYWCLANQRTIKKVRSHYSRCKMPIAIVLVFKFDTNKILKKSTQAKSAIKELDTSNRVKLIEDAISSLIDIDDSYFFDLLPMKRTGKNTVDVYALDLTQDIDKQIIEIRERYARSLLDIIDYIKEWNEKSQAITQKS